ncbi:MAG TPA: hydrogenase maturation protease [Gaiellaceae bacterium]|nr:hydrogenase maturation protease [Gaiellaceae bacterium]
MRAGDPQPRSLHLLRDALPPARGRPQLTLVLGIGNAWQGDDAAGLLAAQRLRERALAGVEVRELEGEPVSLVEAWDGADRVFVVDAVRSGAAPGTVHRLDATHEPLPATLSAASTHTLGVGEAIELARALGRLPALVVLYGIEAESIAAGAGLTPAVERAVDEAVERLLAELA